MFLILSRPYGDPAAADPAFRGREYRLRIGKTSAEVARKLLTEASRAGLDTEMNTVRGDHVLRVEGDMDELRSLMEKADCGGSSVGELERAAGRYSGREGVRLELPGTEVSSGRQMLMAILNVTPDSFHDGGRSFDRRKAVERGLEMAAEGADIIDIGGESTRPGATPVDAKEEARRVLPVVSRLCGLTGVPLSVDTMKPEVAEAALDAGASMINDVTGLRSPKMRALVAERGCPVVIMHMKGRPRTMQSRPRYTDVTYEVCLFLHEMIERGEAAGIRPDRIVVDPGIGFGKTAGHSIQLLRELDALRTLGKPILLGVSRKSFIARITGETENRLEGSIAAALYGCAKGANILRVHDVPETRRALAMWQGISGPPVWK